MRRVSFCSLLCLLYAIPGTAQTNAGGPPAPANTIKVVELTVQPAAEPIPALRYRFVPSLADQIAGNAEPLYGTATQLFAPRNNGELGEKLDNWLAVPLKDLPREEVRTALGELRSPIHYVELASRREWCRWDLPLQSEGMSTLLPMLNPMRGLAKALAVRTRLEIAEGRFDDAVGTLQAGFVMARHIGEGPVLIHSLVGTAVASMMTERVAELIQAAGPRNLYWALAGLPRPFISLQDAMQFEMSGIELAIPQLRNLETAELTPQQWRRLSDETVRVLNAVGDAGSSASSVSWDERMLTTVAALKSYPRAKQSLISKGRTPEQVEAMPVQQVVLIYSYDRYVQWRDDLWKWFDLPYWQARERMAKAQRAFQERGKGLAEGYPFAAFLPDLEKAYYRTTMLDRRIAALQCIEAIRMYAATHDGRLPASLSDIAEAPAPIDPITGRSFAYTQAGNRATLEAAAPAGESPKEGTRYEIALTK